MTSPLARRTEVRIEITIGASVADVWRAWTDPALLKQWIWASLTVDTEASVDLRVGGAWSAVTRFAGGEHHGEGRSAQMGIYLAIEPAQRLLSTLHWDADVGYNRVGGLSVDEAIDVRLAAEGNATRLSFVHLGIPDDGMSARTHEAGWREAFTLIEKVLSGG